MTSMLERPIQMDVPTPLADALLSPNLETPTLLETVDGCTTGQGLNSVTKRLISAARQAGVECVGDNLYDLGDFGGKHLTVGHDVEKDQAGKLANVNILQFVDPDDGTRIRYEGSEANKEGQTIVDFKVVKERRFATSQTAIFRGPEGAPLSDDASEFTRQLVKNVLDVAVDQYQQDVITKDALEKIVVPLVNLESAPVVKPVRKVGRKVVGWFAKVGRDHETVKQNSGNAA